MKPPLFERHRKPPTTELFPGLGFYRREEAQQRHWQMCRDHKAEHGDVPGWLRPILLGRARAITAAGPGERSRIGRSMLAARGGYALQEQLREAGLGGPQHPHCRKAREAKARRAREREQATCTAGTPPPADSLGLGLRSLKHRREREEGQLLTPTWEATGVEKPRSKWLLESASLYALAKRVFVKKSRVQLNFSRGDSRPTASKIVRSRG